MINLDDVPDGIKELERAARLGLAGAMITEYPLEGFPDLAHDDEVDACSGAWEMLNPQMKSWGLYELYRQQAEQLRAEKEGS